METKTGWLEGKGLIKRFNAIQVLHGVDLQIGPGEVVGYLGPNGSGKTVTTRMLTGLLSRTAAPLSTVDEISILIWSTSAVMSATCPKSRIYTFMTNGSWTSSPSSHHTLLVCRY
jgi:ABC-type branched-subunit amino acid transport system ATPase component